ncbi:hypothetical protein MACJ_004083 [Theileria orientalis]|uniref:Uncharacterized protein n=1 Tax=Theileria orientalis TaxID=68886 RepID=A0A976SL97_THEOR|nr:hypothetical protein MACJ_004083 [Theileria orientalis]
MTTICLLNYTSSYFAGSGRITVKCEENYKCSNLFRRYEHKLTTPSEGKIYIYKGKSHVISYLYDYATLKPENGYESSKLEKVYVYTNRFDSTNSFLILVFCFTNGSPSVKNKYYSYSELKPSQNTSMKINSLTDYNTESDILCSLIQENDKLSEFLTYDIIRTPANGNGPCAYNCDKIQVKNDTTNGNASPKLEGTEFKRYKHTPNNGTHNGKKACVIYNCQALLKRGSNGVGKNEVLQEVQGETYKHVCVYFGEKAKRKWTATGSEGDCKPGTSAGSTCPPSAASEGSTTCKTGQGTCTAPAIRDTTSPCAIPDQQDVPLMLELLKNAGDNGQPDYYVHRKKDEDYYWIKLTGENGSKVTQNTLTDLLQDIGLHTKKSGTGDKGYQVLQKLLSSAGLNGATAGSNGDLSSHLQKATGQTLTKLLKATANGTSSSQNSQANLLTLLLRRIQFDLTSSVVILLDKNCKTGRGRKWPVRGVPPRFSRLDEEFVEETRRLYKMAHGKDRPAVSPDFISNDRDLEDLIEARAYEIRKSLQIDYGEKTQDRLILSTSAHCWEGWPLGYLVSGGALSVAAGGSWKFVVMAVGQVGLSPDPPLKALMGQEIRKSKRIP